MYNDGSMSRVNGSHPLTMQPEREVTMAVEDSSTPFIVPKWRDIATKRCPVCEQTKSVYDFGFQKNGYPRGWCKTCSSIKFKEWVTPGWHKEYYAAHRSAEIAKQRRYALRHPDRIRARTLAWMAKNAESIKARKSAYYKVNAEQARAYAREWAQRNRDRMLENKRKWRAANPHKGGEYMALRKMRVRQAMPAWANVDAIKSIYAEARRLGQTVDHIVPIRSKLVCGLHVEMNLQVMPKPENGRKANRYWPDMP